MPTPNDHIPLSYDWREQLAAWGITPLPLSHVPTDHNEHGWPDPWQNPNAPEHEPPF